MTMRETRGCYNENARRRRFDGIMQANSMDLDRCRVCQYAWKARRLTPRSGERGDPAISP